MNSLSFFLFVSLGFGRLWLSVMGIWQMFPTQSLTTITTTIIITTIIIVTTTISGWNKKCSGNQLWDRDQGTQPGVQKSASGGDDTGWHESALFTSKSKSHHHHVVVVVIQLTIVTSLWPPRSSGQNNPHRHHHCCCCHQSYPHSDHHHQCSARRGRETAGATEQRKTFDGTEHRRADRGHRWETGHDDDGHDRNDEEHDGKHVDVVVDGYE